MSDPHRPSHSGGAARRVHARLTERAGQPWSAPAGDFAERVMARLDAGARAPSPPERRTTVRVRWLAAAALVVAATLAYRLRPQTAEPARDARSLAVFEDLLGLRAGSAALGVPEELLTSEWEAVVHDARAMLGRVGSMGPRW